MSWDGILFGVGLACVVFIYTLIVKTAIDFYDWVWHRKELPPFRRR